MDPTAPAVTLDTRPRLRPTLSAERDGSGFVLFDPLGVGRPVRLSPFAMHLAARFFDGTRTVAAIHAEVAQPGGRTSAEDLRGLVAGLDDALLLDGPAFREAIGGPVRKPACIGCYDADPDKLRPQLDRLFTAPGGPGRPDVGSRVGDGGRLRAVLVPHMDYARGGVCYGYGFKELAERTDASLFVVVATSHYSAHRFTLTRQHFDTPLGVVETDQPYIDRLVAAYGDGLFDDPVAHVPEHSVELEVVLLRYLFETVRPVRIVPLLVGSFRDRVDGRAEPRGADDIGRMVAALRAAEAGAGEPVCYVISGDLAHIGPKFGDKKPVDADRLAASRKRDEGLLAAAAGCDPGGYFAKVTAERDRRRICGFPPTYLTLDAVRPHVGKVLDYRQFIHPAGLESVSFASMSFEG